MVTFLVEPFMECAFHNLLCFLEQEVILMTLMRENKMFIDRVIGLYFANFIADTMNLCFLVQCQIEKLFCIKASVTYCLKVTLHSNASCCLFFVVVSFLFFLFFSGVCVRLCFIFVFQYI